MILKTLQLSNFRCFTSLAVEFDEKLTVLIAENGNGKTTILDAAAIAMDGVVRYHAGGKANTPGRAILGRDDVRLGKESSTIAAAIKGDQDSLFEWSDSIEIEGPDKIRHSSGKRPHELKQYLDRQWRGESLDDAPLIVFYRAGRAFSQPVDSGKFRLQSFDPKTAFDLALDASAGLEIVQHWFYQVETEEAREKAKLRDFNFEDPRLRAVRHAVQTMIPEATGMGFEPGKTGLSIFWHQPQRGTGDLFDELPGSLFLHQLSDGYRTLLAMVMDLAVRLVIANPKREDPLNAHCVLMIDEVDLHLHPRLQQQVIPRLQKTFPNAQLIVTTHSAEVVTTARKENIRILREGRIRECPTPTYGAKMSDVVREVMGLPSLRPDNEVGNTFKSLFLALEDGDSEEARRLLPLVKEWDPNRNDADITRAEMLLRRIEKQGKP
jgi:predicted ATP-binding protein involved in virulence